MPGKLARYGTNRGGARPDAGRKKVLNDAGRRDFATQFIRRTGGEVGAWVKAYEHGTREQRPSLLRFMTSMLRGYPAQQQRVTGADGRPIQVIFQGPRPRWAPKQLDGVHEDAQKLQAGMAQRYLFVFSTSESLLSRS